MLYFGLFLLQLYIFFIMYVASMAMVRAHKEKKLNPVLWALCVPFIIVALLVDALNNILVFSILFFELPRELLVTERLRRHVGEDSIRGKMARWFGVYLLNPFDPTGDHLD